MQYYKYNEISISLKHNNLFRTMNGKLFTQLIIKKYYLSNISHDTQIYYIRGILLNSFKRINDLSTGFRHGYSTTRNLDLRFFFRDFVSRYNRFFFNKYESKTHTLDESEKVINFLDGAFACIHILRIISCVTYKI